MDFSGGNVGTGALPKSVPVSSFAFFGSRAQILFGISTPQVFGRLNRQRRQNLSMVHSQNREYRQKLPRRLRVT